jgi:hypothetical protein
MPTLDFMPDPLDSIRRLYALQGHKSVSLKPSFNLAHIIIPIIRTVLRRDFTKHRRGSYALAFEPMHVVYKDLTIVLVIPICPDKNPISVISPPHVILKIVPPRKNVVVPKAAETTGSDMLTHEVASQSSNPKLGSSSHQRQALSRFGEAETLFEKP